MKKMITPALLVGLLVLAIGTIKKLTHNDAEYTVGILQTASHPALDQAREGFVKTLRERLGSKVEFVIQMRKGLSTRPIVLLNHFILIVLLMLFTL